VKTHIASRELTTKPAARRQPAGRSEPELSPQPRVRWDLAVELAAAFVTGVAVMRYFFADHAGVPEYDSYYHIKMAMLLPEIGFIDRFPWLSQTIFADKFISHHWGFQAALMPFIHAAQALGYEPYAGAKWALCFFFGCGLLLFNLLLQQQRVPLRWLWIALYLLGPEQYFGRHTYIRAISLSALCMLGIVILMFRQRYILMGLAIAVYTQVYLGSVMYSPLIVIAYFVAKLVGPEGDRELDWKLAVFGFGGWLLGFLIHPYRDGMFDFLRVQVLITGLNPVITVGNEWLPYENVWEWARMCGATLLTLGICLCLRLRFGPRLDSRSLAALLISAFFLALVLKTRRFIESWPLFSLIASAMLAAPVFSEWFGRDDEAPTPAAGGSDRMDLAISRLTAAGILAVFFGLGYWLDRNELWGREAFERYLPVWIVLAMLLAAAPLIRIWRARGQAVSPHEPLIGASTVVVVGFAAVVLFAWRAAPIYAGVRQTTEPVFKLAEMKEAMDFLQANSEPGSVVFTDDWDIFPAYFYHNHHNYYIVGLDPVFCYHRNPEVWERYVKVSRGEVPRKFTAEWSVTEAPPGWRGTLSGLRDALAGERRMDKKTISVSLDDIPDTFGCSYVITDRDHGRLRAKLEADTRLFERIYPAGPLKSVGEPEFVIHRVKPGPRVPASAPSEPNADGSALGTPASGPATEPAETDGDGP